MPLISISTTSPGFIFSVREGRANTARGAAHFLRETVGRVRYAGANGRLTLRGALQDGCPCPSRSRPRDRG